MPGNEIPARVYCFLIAIMKSLKSDGWIRSISCVFAHHLFSVHSFIRQSCGCQLSRRGFVILSKAGGRVEGSCGLGNSEKIRSFDFCIRHHKARPSPICANRYLHAVCVHGGPCENPGAMTAALVRFFSCCPLWRERSPARQPFLSSLPCAFSAAENPGAVRAC